jgi:hypothetical protein
VGTGKRSVNWIVWAGFATAVAAAVSYIPIFVPFPITRDLPWANFLLFLAAGAMLVVGLRRAYARPERYRGKISGVILSVLSLGLLVLFSAGTLWFARLPVPQTALRVGQQAPDFTLTDATGSPVSLSQLRQSNRAVLLIFYRGYW